MDVVVMYDKFYKVRSRIFFLLVDDVLENLGDIIESLELLNKVKEVLLVVVVINEESVEEFMKLREELGEVKN